MNRATHSSPPPRPGRSRCQFPIRLALAVLASGPARLLSDEPSSLPATAPLHQQIDELVAQANPVAASIIGDAEFLRRISLDLIGVPPSIEEIRSFLADGGADKRNTIITRLLSHPRYAWHMAEAFDVMLMERRPSVHVTADEWQQYLMQAFRANKPYNELAKEILAADGAEPQPRAAAKFYLDRLADPNLLTRDVGRIFFGRDFQCAQCHDHPLVDDYHQADYHGLLAFFSASSLFTAPALDGKSYFIEKAGVDQTFESVFVEGKHRTGPKLPGAAPIDEPRLYPDQQYVVKPADGVRPKPSFSRRAKLAETAADGTNRAFNENIANRLWAHMMGRGLVEPVDQHHAGNPPANPPLMKLLGEAFAASGFDVKAFLRELALTQTYQRSIDPPADPASLADRGATQAAELQGRLAQAIAAEEEADKRYTAAYQSYEKAEEQALPVFAELDQAAAAAAQAVAKLDEANAQLAATQSRVSAKAAISSSLTDAVAKTAEVAKALPQDQEIVAAAQKFAERQQQVAAEIGALQAEAQQKTEAAKASEGNAAAARDGMQSVCARLDPVAASLDEQARTLTSARQAWAEHKSAATRLETALDGVKQLAGLKALSDQISTARHAAGAAAAAFEQARTAADAPRAALEAAQQARQSVAEQAAQADAAAAVAAQAQQQWEQLTATISEAATKIDVARQSLPNDSHLAQAAGALSAKLTEAKAEGEVRSQRLAEASAAQQTAHQQLAAADERIQRTAAEIADQQQKVAAAEQAAAAANGEVDRCLQHFHDSLATLHDQWTHSFAVQPLKPLTPEQLCWSIFQITGVYDRYLAAEQAELEKSTPLSDADKNDPAKVAARDLEIRQRVYDKLKGNVAAFVSVYAPAAGQPQDDFFASANQALFVANGGSINSWLAPAGGNFTQRMIEQSDPKLAAEELYLAVLGRLPSEAEVTDVVNYLAARPAEKAACVQELAWALVTSAEFRFNH